MSNPEQEKVEALKNLIRDAAWESYNGIRRMSKNPLAPQFDPAGEQKACREDLVDVLLTTDALYVLDRIVNGVPDE